MRWPRPNCCFQQINIMMMTIIYDVDEFVCSAVRCAEIRKLRNIALIVRRAKIAGKWHRVRA